MFGVIEFNYNNKKHVLASLPSPIVNFVTLLSGTRVNQHLEDRYQAVFARNFNSGKNEHRRVKPRGRESRRPSYHVPLAIGSATAWLIHASRVRYRHCLEDTRVFFYKYDELRVLVSI